MSSDLQAAKTESGSAIEIEAGDAIVAADIIPTVEALLYSADAPLSAMNIADVLYEVQRLDEAIASTAVRAASPEPGGDGASLSVEPPDGEDPEALEGSAASATPWRETWIAVVHDACSQLARRYEHEGSALQVVEVASGYRLGTRPSFDPWVRVARRVDRRSRLSVPLLETLAVVAYRQPVTSAEIGAIRGRDPSSVLRRLRELGLLRIAGRKRTVGRPFTFGTTEAFLELFGLRDLTELPAPEEFQELLEAG